jgi:signal transduction histidine kinase
VLLAAIVSVAIGLAILSFQYSSRTREQILDVASENARSTANIQVQDLSVALASKVDTVSTNLQVMTEAPLIEEQNVERTVQLFNAAYDSTSDFASSYFWVDAEGKLLWANAFVNETLAQQYIGGDRSFRDYYIQPRDTLMPYYTTLIESVDSVPRLYIGHPIIGDSDGEFKGVIVAAIDLDEIGRFAEEQLASNSESSTGLMDKNGVVLYSSNSLESTGRNIFDPEIQSSLPPEIKDSFNQLIRNALDGQTGSADFSVGNNAATIAYRPVTVRGNEFAVLFVVTPHVLAGNAAALVEQMQVLNTFIIMAIGAVASVTAVVMLTWNKRLSNMVDGKTQELKAANDMLTESNSQLQATNATLAEVNEKLKAHEKMQNEFINVAAHELRTPVQPILGIVDELEERLAEESDRIVIERPEIEMLARNSSRLVKLASDILDVSRIEANTLVLKKQPTDLVNKIERVVEDAKSFVGKDKRVQIVFERGREDGPVMVEVDRVRMFEVLSNLIRNAVGFTEKGTIAVSLEKEDGHARVSISDTGKGIDPEIMPRLFTKFATSSEQGTGLGLYISKSIIEAHGGRIWAQNNPGGRGATFTFTLPMEKVQQVESTRDKDLRTSE